MFKLNKKTVAREIVICLSVFLAVVGVVSAATTIGSNIATGGNITVAPAYGLDVSAAGALNIGTTTATSINIGLAGVTTSILGAASVTATSTLATTTAKFLSVGSTTPAINRAEVLIQGVTTATTTLTLSTGVGATKGTCIEMVSSAGADMRMYVPAAGTTLTVEAGRCK